MRWLLALVLFLLAANVAWWAWRGQHGPLWSERPTAATVEPVAPEAALRPAGEPVEGSTPIRVATRPAPAVAIRDPGTAVASPSSTAAPSSAPLALPGRQDAPSGLLVPVQGVDAADLSDTFGDARGSERMHEALDIMAPAGTPVLAVADGRIEKLFDSDRGGLTVYQFEPSGAWCYYYAHLQAYAPGLAEGQAVRRGEVLGYVGSTGNADPAAPHLHFAIFALTPERQWWTGTPVNPYPVLTGAGSR